MKEQWLLGHLWESIFVVGEDALIPHGCDNLLGYFLCFVG